MNIDEDRIRQTKSSESYIGGKAPKEFIMPRFDFNAPFQYLGKLAKSDEVFSWLPFDLHLTAPIFLNFDKLFMDYSNPLNPKIMNLKELSQTDTSFENLESNSEIVFKKTSIAKENNNTYGDVVGYINTPIWIQYPDIPICPKSKQTMQFLCQLKSNIEIITEYINIEFEDDFYKRYFNHLNFWGDGDLYIFFKPESKIICFLIQNT